ncbi:MAG: 30S ribosomal protein S18, partial [Thermocrinis sp.]|uniref:30S ribosomal protein S18 n=1 Tax=Thermocrinis sp. TaxID=2024383 RepID=UPI003BFCE84C
SYKEYEELAKFLSERGKIIGRRQAGVCAKHQRILSREIKRARQLALLPYLII